MEYAESQTYANHREIGNKSVRIAIQSSGSLFFFGLDLAIFLIKLI